MLTTYVLVIEKRVSSSVQIGPKRIVMESGVYLYVGSAKKGLEQRLARHVKKQKKRFWHIDYITSRRDAITRNVYLSPFPECETVTLVSRLGSLFGHKLGSSDCRCPSHFVKLDLADTRLLKEWMTVEGFLEFRTPVIREP